MDRSICIRNIKTMKKLILLLFALGNLISYGQGNFKAKNLYSTEKIYVGTDLVLPHYTFAHPDGTIGQVQITNGAGILSWSSVPILANAWSLTGNAGTIDGTNFIGTTDNVPFNIRVNNQKAGRIDHILGNAFFGYQAGNSNTTGYYNTASGWRSFYLNTGGYLNTVVGADALYSNIIGNSNTAIGVDALYSNTGNNNTAAGIMAGQYNKNGSNNIFFGYKSGYYGNWNNKGFIDVLQRADSATQLIASPIVIDFHATPASQKVTLNSKVYLPYLIDTVNMTNKKVLVKSVITNQVETILATDLVASSAWSLTGNAGTVDGTNFIGTTDNVPFNFRTNNTNRMIIDNLGNVRITDTLKIGLLIDSLYIWDDGGELEITNGLPATGFAGMQLSKSSGLAAFNVTSYHGIAGSFIDVFHSPIVKEILLSVSMDSTIKIWLIKSR